MGEWMAGQAGSKSGNQDFLLSHLFKFPQDDTGCDYTTNSFLDLTSTLKQNIWKHKYGCVYVLTTPNIANQPF